MTRTRPRAAPAALALLAMVVAGCYVPAPADPTNLGRGEDIRVVLSDGGMERLSRVSPRVTRELAGRLTAVTDDSLTVATRLRAPAYAGGSLQAVRQNLTFARSDIQEVTVDHLHRGRTAVVVAAGVAAVAVLLADLLGADEGGGGGPVDPPAPRPVVRVPWG